MLDSDDVYIYVAFNNTVRIYDTSTEDVVSFQLNGHKGNITSIKIVDKIIYTTSDGSEVIAWQIVKGKGYIIEQSTTKTT